MEKLFWLLLLLCMLPLAAGAQTLYASPEGLTLTEALALCSDGDVIELADGIYAEPRETFP